MWWAATGELEVYAGGLKQTWEYQGLAAGHMQKRAEWERISMFVSGLKLPMCKTEGCFRSVVSTFPCPPCLLSA